MKTAVRAALLLGLLALAGCDHHSSQTRSAPAPKGDAELTGVPVQPIDSMRAPRATLVALPGQPIPRQSRVAAAVPPRAFPVANSAAAPVRVASAPVPAAVPKPAPPAPTPAPVESSASENSAAESSAMADSTSNAIPDSVVSAPPPLPGETATSTPGSVGEAIAAAPTPGTQPPAPDHSEVAVIETSLGKIIIELDDFAAPKTCKNFRELVADQFYNDTVFHRVIPNFIIQGGDPKSKSSAADRDTYGLGSPGYTLEPEIALKHDRGAVGMARLPDSLNPRRESNGSQFYICLVPCPTLDDQYTVFGHVISGMDVAEKIAEQPRDSRDNPLQRIEMKVTLQPRDEAMASSTANP